MVAMVFAVAVNVIAQPIGVETQITTDTTDQNIPAIYGDRIVWHDYRNGNADIYMYDLSMSTESQITTDTAYQGYSAFYGDKIVWQDDRNGWNNYDIYMYDISTSTETQITTNTAWQEYPAINGDRIVWQDSRNGNKDIYMYDLSTSTETQITTVSSSEFYPAIYSDKIVWADWRNGNADIYMYDLSTSTESQITTNTAWQNHPAIYDDKIVWGDGRNGNHDIYMYDLSTSTESQITTNTEVQMIPAIYGDNIVWHDSRNGNYDIYMYDLSTSTESQLTTNTAHQMFPAVYGDSIVWQDFRNGNLDIYMMDLTGGYTPEGENVPVTPTDTTTGDTPVTLEFEGVDEGGMTTLTTSSTGTPPPTGFKLGAPPTYFEISTTAVLTPDSKIKICIDYSGLTFEGDEKSLELRHWEDTDDPPDGVKDAWVDRTIPDDPPDNPNPNTVDNIICAVVDSLSPFAIFEPIDLSSFKETKLIASDSADYDWFGSSVFIEGDTALIGARFGDGAVPVSGSAYVYVRDGNGVWTEEAELTASDGTSSARFGNSVFLSGDTALIGAHETGEAGSGSGSAYVFVRDDEGVWTEQAKLTASDAAAFDRFGFSVSVSGDTALIGSPYDQVSTSVYGSVYVFERDATGAWTEETKLTASDGASGDFFGSTVFISGDTSLIGAWRGDDAGTTGSAYVFKRDAAGDWTEEAKLTASDAAAHDQFGHSVSLSGDTALIGAHLNDDVGSATGSAYIFVRDDATGDWTEDVKLTASDKSYGDGFGQSVSISGGIALIGAPFNDDACPDLPPNLCNSGSAYVFSRDDATGVWTEEVKLTASDGAAGDFFGASVSVSGYTALIGAVGDDVVGSNSGSVYVFVPNDPPSITAFTASPNPVEGSPVTFTVTATDPNSDSLQYRFDFNNDGTWDTAWSNSLTAPNTWDDDYSGTVTVEVSDGSLSTTATTPVTVLNADPFITSITTPFDPTQVNVIVDISADFTDPGILDTHTATIDWGDENSSPGVVTEVDGSGSVSGSHTYTIPGVYLVTLTITDDDGATASITSEYVVVYDPTGAFVIGGGMIDSPPGAIPDQPDIIGKAGFGFVSKYQKGATTPGGNTQFRFHAGEISFHSTSYDWMVVAGPKAMFKGTGTVNREGNFGFLISAIDGERPGGGGVDRFRIKIWDKDNFDTIVYDNGLGDAEDADPATPLTHGSIKIHK
jgi:beta propeller repeat protein